MTFKFKPLAHIIFCILLLFSSKALARKLVDGKAQNPSVSSILIFGDSTADPGNNNFISTSFRSNFSPYGRDFVNQTASGRFSNGRLGNDFIAKYVGIKEYVPPYLDPTLSIEELFTGVSFASAGSGFDPLTPTIGNVLSISKQLENFKEYQAKLEAVIGKEKTKELISNALFLVSAGTNDFIVNYFTLPIRSNNYTIPSYMSFVLQESSSLLKELIDQGARRIGVVGLPPMGCLPAVITLYGDNPILDRKCVDSFSSVSRDYNKMLQNELNNLMNQIQGSRIAYLDIYGPLEDMVLGRNYHFDVVSSGCCGTGLVETSFLCNPNSLVCTDAKNYMFWDSIHPTERTSDLVVQSFQLVIDALVKN